MSAREWKPASVGVLLLDGKLQLLHYNDAAASILRYPKKRGVPEIRTLLPPARASDDGHSKQPLPPSIEFKSGRRRYLCRVFRLDSQPSRQPESDHSVVVVLDRVLTKPIDVTTWGRDFQLTSRERETVALLLKGLSSKEIAAAMEISPSTVKSFLKLIMVKVGASNRTGIIAKILGQVS